MSGTGQVTGIAAGKTYAVRLAVETAGGIGRSAILPLTTLPPPAAISLQLASGTQGSQTVSAGGSATFSLSASDGGNGYTGTATFSCAGEGTAMTCTVAPSQVTPGSAVSPLTVTVNTTAAQSARAAAGGEGQRWILCLILGAGLFGAGRRARRLGLLVLMIGSVMGATSGAGRRLRQHPRVRIR